MNLKRIVMVVKKKSAKGIPDRRLLNKSTSKDFVLNKQENVTHLQEKRLGTAGNGSLLHRILNL